VNGLLALAFTAGMLAPVNPCGFALLPAYLTHTLTDQPEISLPRRVGRALSTGTALAIGFAATLAIAGLAISAGARPLITAAPWLGLLVGIILLILGGLTVFGHGPRLRLPSMRIQQAGITGGWLRWALFGIGYAAASLACSFGVLLAVIAQAQTSTNLAGQALLFLAYAAGSTVLLLTLAIGAALTGAALTRYLRVLSRHHRKITAALLVLTGGYLTIYWLPAATGSARTGQGVPGIDRWSAEASTWIQTHLSAVIIVGGLAILTTVVAYTMGHLTLRASRRPSVPTAPVPVKHDPAE